MPDVGLEKVHHEAQESAYSTRMGIRIGQRFHVHSALPKGSRLGCGRPARRRKAVGRQFVPRQGHNVPLPLERSPPASFERLLGVTFPRVSLLTTEYENVAIRIAHFELPVALGLLLEGHLNKWLTAYSVVERMHAPHPQIGIPKPFWTSGGEIRLLVAGQ